MIQKTYHAEDRRGLKGVLQTIQEKGVIRDRAHTLLLLHESSDKKEEYGPSLRMVREWFPGIRMVGLTMIAPLNPGMHLPGGVTLSVLSFDTSEFDIISFDCSRQKPETAAHSFSEQMRDIPDAKGVLFLCAGNAIDPDQFLKNIDQEACRVPVFGTQAGAHIGGPDLTRVFLDGEICSNTILTVVFRGPDLHVKTDSSFGWRPLGREMTITDVVGGRLLRKVDGRNILDVYYDYLHIVPDRNFYTNVCAFPLVVRSGSQITSRVPLYYTDDGVILTTNMQAGDQVSLSYAKENYLLSETVRMADGMIDFRPQAMILSACVNRRIFMGNISADREIEMCRAACPDLIWGAGYGEILRHEGSGGFLNSTLVAAAMREGPAAEVRGGRRKLEPPEEDTEYIPLSDRLVTFLEATTKELRSTISDLQELASHDRTTNILNRMTIEYELDRAFDEARLQGAPLSILLFDIDFFKSVNDQYGHAVGDQVLRQTAETVSSLLDEESLFGRWGGDEFLCIFRGRETDSVYRMAEMIRRKIAETDFSPVPSVTLSLGIAGLKDADGAHNLTVLADRALYHSKHCGRDQASVYCRDYEDELE